MADAFDGEDPAWVRAYLAAAPGATAALAAKFADDTLRLLAERAVVRRERAEREAAERKAAREVIAARVCKVGCYANGAGYLWDVLDVVGSTVTLASQHVGTYKHVPLTMFAETAVAELAEEHDLHAAPENRRTEVVTRLKVAQFLVERADAVELMWDGRMIYDIQVRGLRPTRATWDGLRRLHPDLPLTDYAMVR